MSLKVEHLTGGYGQVPVIKDLSFEVPAGQVVGLIGLNGAGKSTTIKHLIGLLKPQAGTVSLNDAPLGSNEYRQQLAYVPETPVLYPELTLKEHIDLTIMAYQLDKKTAWATANEMLKTFRLDNKLDWFPDNFSKGMKQKVMIVTAFMTNADLFIIDEPFTGLDPLGIHDLLDIVQRKRDAGASILMSTHILATAQQYADQFVLLNNGTVRANGSLAELKQQFGMSEANLDDIYLAMTKEG
ncbi:ABC transporter ATP-binding protein [Lacticaseibacillus saniviri]|uniref:ABC-type transporter ATP-binding protein EcsA n=1 Tax=Lacticaseibacillus saniviri JCM 17471 = DSM 24301 TaxID=1293598 RepID=A0A0R2MWA7_9LACO|nr:ABC transporter ATP-binding protein [Lacticaseibacillus saniviri]KRO16674.1 ABC-type transporter ATP-binding protein EcsA [Lacticaseibacillus saniviri JCM 17471 = DSM 24301]MCG4280814.1 ABC transporter ATP-binding protein [Lacticaseibacillus saniviri]